jgi:hypothetical protein
VSPVISLLVRLSTTICFTYAVPWSRRSPSFLKEYWTLAVNESETSEGVGILRNGSEDDAITASVMAVRTNPRFTNITIIPEDVAS